METRMGGSREAFPSTMWTMVREAGVEGGRESLNRLLTLYWRPIYAYIRRRWSSSVEDAKDFTQGFIESFLEGDYLTRVEPGRGSFRAYLKTAVEHHMIDEHRRARALKRGGGRVLLDGVDLDRLGADDPSMGPESAFDREWVRLELERGVRRLESDLRQAGKGLYFDAFRLFYLEARQGGPENPQQGEAMTYAQVAGALGIAVVDVGNYLASARARLREILREQVRPTVGSAEAESDELSFLLDS